MESTTGNLVHLEEYVDTIISLPHEIQRNLTMIREHDSQVQDVEKDLFKDINDFMSLQSKEKEIPGEERIELIKRIKDSFLSTLTHCEEKVSLANQCYNSVEKHLVKMEEDLKCFEEEIRLSGYAELLEKVRIERQRQKQQVRNKKRLEAAEIEDESEEGGEEGTEEQGDNGETAADGSSSDNSGAEQQQQQTQQQQQGQKKRKTSNARSNNSSVKKQRSASTRNVKTGGTSLIENESDDDNQSAVKISRAERLLRRNKPNFVEEKPREEGDTTDGGVLGESKEDSNENEGDDEAESEGDDFDGDEEIDNEGNVNNDETGGYESEEESRDEPVKIEELGDSELLKTSINSLSSLSGVSSGEEPQNPPRSINPPSNPSSEPLYCTCKRVSFGQMIACDGKDCPVEWFHIGCVGLKSLPKGKWYCRECQEAMDAKTAAQMAAGMGTRSSRRS